MMSHIKQLGQRALVVRGMAPGLQRLSWNTWQGEKKGSWAVVTAIISGYVPALTQNQLLKHNSFNTEFQSF